MPFLLESRYAFDQVTRLRGEDYFRRGRVLRVTADSASVDAVVFGSSNSVYRVTIDVQEMSAGSIVARCTCPRYVNGHLCKHIWATLCEVQRQRIFAEERIPEDLVILHADDLLSDDEDPEIIDGTFQPVPAASKSLTVSHSTQPTWRNLVPMLAADQDAPLLSSNNHRQPSAKHAVQAWFAVDISASLQRGGLVLDLHHRASLRDGGWGQFKRLQLRRGETGPLSDPEECRLIGLLMGNQLDDEIESRPYYINSYYQAQQTSRLVIAPALYDVVLPRLCATGRLVWYLQSSVPVEEGKPLAWDDGSPWRLRLQVQAETNAESYGLSGQLFRDGQARSLNDPILMLAHGLVIFPESMARLDAAEHFSWAAALRRTPRIEVPKQDQQEFFEWLWRHPNVPTVELPEDLRVEHVQGVPRGKLAIQSPDRYSRSSTLFANVGFLYEERFECSLQSTQSSFFDAESMRVIHRDLQAERELIARLSDLGLSPTPAYRQEEAHLFFSAHRLTLLVEQLTSQGWWVESEGRLLRRAGSYQLNVKSNLDWFEVDGQIEFDGIQVGLPSVLAALRNRQKSIRLDDGTQGILPEEWLKRFGNLIELGQQEDDTLRFRPSQALLLDALLAAQDGVTFDASFDRLRKQLRSFDGIQARSEPRGFRGELRNYQREGLGWLDFLRTFHFGGCLADDMGLGKTIQVLALLQARRTRRLKQQETRRPSIVVMPKSLVFNWIDEAARFTPRLRVLDYTGTKRQEVLEQLSEGDLLVTTYGTLRRDIVKLKDIHFDYAILDESQAVKNANSQASKACRLLQADHRLAMTGTPVENHLGELWSLFEFLNPGILGRTSTFQTLVKQGQQDDQAVQLLSQALRPFFLRRTKEQVLTELPEKTEQTVYCEMAPKQRRLYDELRSYYRMSLKQRVEQVGFEQSKIHVLEALLRLRQAACHPGLLDEKRAGDPSAKLEVLMEHLREVIDEGHKALVFSQFTSLLALVRRTLDQQKIPYQYLDGQTRHRKAVVQQFQEDPQCPLFLISLKAGGHGLNLTAADYVFILDPWWNPAVESQAIDRAHRLGQTRNVFAYRLICKDTVEEKILELQRSKRELADAIISENNSLIRQLTADDLQLLLG
ncbi:MAG: helicase SNF2 [Planctomycetaceae bacterium]|nr:MAG: helicase SNF2 [Planctomycetaceae bacterium]